MELVKKIRLEAYGRRRIDRMILIEMYLNRVWVYGMAVCGACCAGTGLVRNIHRSAHTHLPREYDVHLLRRDSYRTQ